MGGTSVGEGEFIACQITFVGELVIGSTLDIAKVVSSVLDQDWS